MTAGCHQADCERWGDMVEARMTAFQEGLHYLAKGDAAEAEIYFEEAAITESSPHLTACLAYCMAKVHGEFKQSIALALKAVREEPRNSELYLLLGRIHYLAGQKETAVRVFRLGLRCERNSTIQNELISLGIRQPPPLPFLHRGNPINKYLGILLKRAGLR